MSRALEMYSGIGGMHYALQMATNSRQDIRVVGAIDINDLANRTYQANFPCQVFTRTIDSIPLKFYDDIQFDVLLLSPPCQPFTRQGIKKDASDTRTFGFLHFVQNILPYLKSPPLYIFLENVCGFETSFTRDLLVRQLAEMQFKVEEYLLSPSQFGFPNSRLRYYLIARRHSEKFDATDIQHELSGFLKPSIQPIGEYLDTSAVSQAHFLSNDLLGRLGWQLDITTSSSDRSCCFTKNYTSFCKGTGSVLATRHTQDLAAILKEDFVWRQSQHSTKTICPLSLLSLRYFTPQEIARLHGFPSSFYFPSHISIKQQYALLGNSLNVVVASHLIRRLFSDL